MKNRLEFSYGTTPNTVGFDIPHPIRLRNEVMEIFKNFVASREKEFSVTEKELGLFISYQKSPSKEGMGRTSMSLEIVKAKNGIWGKDFKKKFIKLFNKEVLPQLRKTI